MDKAVLANWARAPKPGACLNARSTWSLVGGSRWCDRGYVGLVDLAWRWLVGGVVAIVVGLAVWWTAFILVPAGVVLLVIGMAKSVRGIGRSVRSRRQL